MSMNASSLLLNSLLGAGSSFSGDIDTHGLIRVDGIFAGSIKTDGKVVISKDARCRGPIRAKSVVVGGIVKGNIFTTERVEILSGAIVVGDIFSPRIDVQDDTVVHGECRVMGASPDLEHALDSFVASHGGFPAGPRETLLKGDASMRADGSTWRP
jgi:cytoskeletal protein CcmA (bactofilin family)